MTEQIKLRLGGEPWLPASTVKSVKQLHFSDMPLAGIILQRGQYFLYECIEGHVADVNLWAYVPLSRREAKRLRKLTGDELTRATQAVYDRSLVVALAVNGRIETAAELVVGEDKATKREEIPQVALDKIDRRMNQDRTAAGVLRMA